MNYPKEIKVKDYFKIHNYFSDIYGNGRTIILMQVGSFHEIYCTNEKGLNLEMLAQELDVICTAKNSKKEISGLAKLFSYEFAGRSSGFFKSESFYVDGCKFF